MAPSESREVATSPSFLRCERVRVLVQSIRWPSQRVSVGALGGGRSCVASGTCLAADAAVYVIPVCGGNGANVLACFPVRLPRVAFVSPALFVLV